MRAIDKLKVLGGGFSIMKVCFSQCVLTCNAMWIVSGVSTKPEDNSALLSSEACPHGLTRFLQAAVGSCEHYDLHLNDFGAKAPSNGAD